MAVERPDTRGNHKSSTQPRRHTQSRDSPIPRLRRPSLTEARGPIEPPHSEPWLRRAAGTWPEALGRNRVGWGRGSLCRVELGRRHGAWATRGTRRPGLLCRSTVLHSRLTGRCRFARPTGHSGEMAPSEFCGGWKRTSISSPPVERGCAVMLAWWAWAMAWAMARPSPCPSPEPVRFCPSCWKG